MRFLRRLYRWNDKCDFKERNVSSLLRGEGVLWQNKTQTIEGVNQMVDIRDIQAMITSNDNKPLHVVIGVAVSLTFYFQFIFLNLL